MDSVSAPLPEDAALTLGSPIVGACLNWFLYGILVVQYLVYLNHAGQDKVWLRTVVHFMFLLDTAQTCLVMTDIFSWYVYNFGNYETLFRFSVSPIDGPLLDSIIMLTVQLVYCWRLWVLGGWKVLPAVATTLAFVSCVSGTFVGLIDQIEGHEPDKAHAVLELWLFTSAVTDILIACSMGYLLLKYRREQITPTTMAMAKRVVILILETNTVTAAAAITLAIIQLPIAKHTVRFSCVDIRLFIRVLFYQGTKLYVVFGYTIGKMYSNSFMVLLNQRTYYNTHSKVSVELGPLSSTNRGNSIGLSSGQDRTAVEVSIIRFEGPLFDRGASNDQGIDALVKRESMG